MAAPPPLYSSLSNAAVNIGSLREAAWADLESILLELPGRTCLALDPALDSMLKLIVTGGAPQLKKAGVETLVHINWNVLSTESFSTIVYITRPDFTLMKQIANQVIAATKHDTNIKFQLYFVPRRSFVCETILKEEGVYGDLKIGELEVDLIPLDDDLLSMEMPNVLRECYIEEDMTSLTQVAKSIMKLQRMFGVIPNVKSKGVLSKMVLDMITRFKREGEADAGGPSSGDASATTSSTPEAEIDTLILLDRGVDVVSPLVTPLTFEALLDQVFHIETATTVIPKSMLGKDDPLLRVRSKAASGRPEEESDTVTVPINSNDKLYAEIRSMNVVAVGQLLQTRSRDLMAKEANRHTLNEISEIRDFVKMLPEMQEEKRSLSKFVNMAEKVQEASNTDEFHEQWSLERSVLEKERTKEFAEYVETLIAKREPVERVLKLLCLMCQTDDGISNKQFDQYRRDILQTYGFEYLFTLMNLERMGLFRGKGGVGWANANWQALKRGLQLTVDGVPLEEPTDIAYVTAGYAPLSARLVQLAMRPGWTTVADSLKLLPGPTEEISQTSPLAGGVTDGGRRRKVVLVFFIGGITYLEQAAIRFLTDKLPYEFIVATTAVMNGDQFMKAFWEPLENGLSLDGDDAASQPSVDSDGELKAAAPAPASTRRK